MDIPSSWRLHTTPDGREIYIPPEEPLEFVTHPDAPLFSGTKNDLEIIEEAVAKAGEGELTDELIELFRQAGLCSLWFFEKRILGAYGPYNQLTDHLHISMANFRQRLLAPGAKGAMFVPRSCFKTTVGTHGADTWEIVRDPDIRIGIVGATKPDARRFSDVIKANFERNDLLRILWPNLAPSKNAEGVINEENWTQDAFTTPGRTRYFPEPTVKILGAGGSTAGNHFDLLNVDDLTGEQHLNSDHVITSEMEKVKNWFQSNANTLLIDPTLSRTFLSATRYAVNDAYDWIAESANLDSEGYFEELPDICQPHEDGEWSVYNREAEEYDLPIFPEKITKKFLTNLKKTKYWTYMLQYKNNPYSAESTEFSDYEPKKFDLSYDHRIGYHLYLGEGLDREELDLNECIVTMGFDPAGSDRKKSERTSRYAAVVSAKDPKERIFILDARAGYWTPSFAEDVIFNLWKKFYPHITRVNLERMGGFTVFYDNIQRAERDRQQFIGLNPITGGGDKDVKIRNYYQPLLEQERLYINTAVWDVVMEELKIFPGGTRKDVLDAGVLASDGVGVPMSREDKERIQRQKARRRRYASRVTGA